MSDALKVFTDLWGQIDKLPFAVLLALFILVVGLMMKRSRRIANGLIPWVTLLIGAGGYTALGDASKVTSVMAGWRQYIILAFYGTILGFCVWMAHKFILKRFEKLLPEGFFPAEEFDTTTFTPPTPAENTKPDPKP